MLTPEKIMGNLQIQKIFWIDLVVRTIANVASTHCKKFAYSFVRNLRYRRTEQAKVIITRPQICLDGLVNDIQAETPRSSRPRTFQEVQALARPELDAVNELIRTRLASEVVLINQIAEHIIKGGGKRLRPCLVLLSANACGYQAREHLQLAAIVEFIHTATLLHDDVVDESDLRRGRQTANALWGNAASVLVGDFLYSRSFQLMVEIDRMPIMRVLADTTNAIAEGEVLQLLQVGNADAEESDYLRVIERKTAVLFAAAMQLGAMIASKGEHIEQALYRFGLALGYAFQIADDVLDYTSDAGTLGKNIGDDLSEGKVTLPLIYALKNASETERLQIRRAIESGGLEELQPIQKTIRDSGAIQYCQERAKFFADAAKQELSVLPDSAWRDALMILADYAIQREH